MMRILAAGASRGTPRRQQQEAPESAVYIYQRRGFAAH